MLNTILEYRKGILFVRLNGSLDKKTYNNIKNIINIIKIDNLNKIVLNLKELDEIDLKGISTLFNIYEIVKKQNGIIYVCEIKSKIKEKLRKNKILKYIEEINSELDSFKIGA